MTIDHLYTKACQGDKSAEDELYRILSDRFSVFAHRKVWNSDEAEEIVQNALTTVFAGYREIQIETSFAAWAHKVLDNKFLSYLQKKRRQGDRVVSIGNQAFVAERWEPDPRLKMRLIDCFRQVGKINQRYARILNLHYLGFKRDEICRKLGTKKPHTHVILSRARAMLKSCLKKGKVSR